MEIEFDLEKNERNIRIRGIPFTLAAEFDFSSALILEDDHQDYGEPRYMSDISTKANPERIDEEFPEWTEEMFARAKSFAESDLPKSFKQAARRSLGESKIAVTVAYSREVIEYFRATGKGWQKRMDEALKEWIAQHSR